MANWTKEQTSFLINLYEGNSILYDVQSSDYLNKIKKENCPKDICKELQEVRVTTISEIKLKIKILKQQYNREKNMVLKSKKSGAGGNEVYVPKLWCYEQLKFLENFSVEKPAYSNIDFDLVIFIFKYFT